MNSFSAGPIRTLAAQGICGFRTYQKVFAEMAPLRMNVTKEDVANTAAFLCSDLARATTGEIVYVDSGYNILGMPESDED